MVELIQAVNTLTWPGAIAFVAVVVCSAVLIVAMLAFVFVTTVNR